MKGLVLPLFYIVFCIGCQGNLGTLDAQVNLPNQPGNENSIPPKPTEMNINSGLLLWLNADKLAGENQEPVSLFPDQSGKGNDAFQSDPNKKPILIKNAINGKSAVRFDGNSDQLDISGAKLNLSGAFDVFVVYRTLGTSPLIDQGVFGNGIGNHFQITHDRSSTIYAYVGNGTNHLTNSLASLVPTYTEWSWNGTKEFNSLVLWEKSYVMGQMTSMEVVNNKSDYHIGVASAYWAGDLSEILLFDRVLTQTERKIIQLYFKEKYNLQQI